jgi:hypothetical protein
MSIQSGVYKDLSSDDYHNDKSSISRSALMDFKKSARHYWAKHINPDRPIEEKKPSWEFGTAFHTFVLEPQLFEENYIIEPEKVLLKDVGRPAYDFYKNQMDEILKSNKKIIAFENWQTLIAMNEALKKHPKYKLIEDALIESSYFWNDADSGLIVKCRPDILQPEIYIDLKTIEDASPESYQREMVRYGYHIQAAMVKDAVRILTGEEIKMCINICVEKKYPYSIGVYIIDDSALEIGQIEYKELLLDMNTCIFSNTYNDYAVQTIGLPRWY